MLLMPLVASLLPLLALLVYSVASKAISRHRPSLSQLMNRQRRRWVSNAVQRETPLDAILASNIMQSVAFFASTTVLLILALFAVIGQLPDLVPTLSQIVLGEDYQVADYALHQVAMLVLFVIAFLAFTLSLRQFNHFCILIGAIDHTQNPDENEIAAIAKLNALGAQNFNMGIRAYYFAIPSVAWFVSSWLSALVTVLTVGFLIHREYYSEARGVIEALDRTIRKPS